MQFLYPNFLWAMATLAIPIIIHLFNFRKYKTVYFSNVAFLQNIRKETKSRSTLKNLIILLLRLLVLASLVLAFARPYIPANNKTELAETPYIAIYVDNSFSMDAEGKFGILLESAKIKVKEITENFTNNARYLLITNEFNLKHQRFVSSDQLLEWITQINSTHITRSIDDIIKKGVGLLNASDTSHTKQMFLLSDFQKNMFHSSNLNLPENMQVFAFPFINESTNNLFIDSLWFESPGHFKGKQEEVHIIIKNLSNESYNEIPIQLFINDSISSSVAFSIAPNSTKKITIPFAKWKSGIYSAHVELNDYPITFDNKLYFNFEIRDKKNVMIISEPNNINYFSALFKDDELIKATEFYLNNIPYNTFENYQVIILNGLTNIPSGLASQTILYAKNGGSIIFIPEADGNLDSYKQITDRIKGVTFEKYLNQEGIISKIDLKNDLFKSVFSDGLSDVQLPKYKGFFPITIQQQTATKSVFESESGFPLFVNIKLDKGQFYLSGLPLANNITDFSTHPLFVPVFYNLALFASTQSELYYWIHPGLITKSIIPSSGIGDFDLEAIASNISLKPNYNISGQQIILYPDIDKIDAGHYKLKQGNSSIDYVSFNYDRSESDIKYYTNKELEERFKTIGVKNISLIDPNSNNLDASIRNHSQGKPLSQIFLWLTVVAIITEIILLRFSKK